MDMNIDPDEPTKVNILSALLFAKDAGLSDPMHALVWATAAQFRGG